MKLPKPEPGALAAALLAFLLALPAVFSMGTYMDEVTYLGHAQRILAGQVMYRDFFEFLAPLSSWVGVPLVALFGHDALSAGRVVSACVLALVAAQMYRLARMQGLPAPAAALPGALVAGGVYLTFPGYSHHWLAQAGLWGAVLAASEGLAAGSDARRPWLYCGLALGLAGLTMQSDGTALAGSLTLWLMLDCWLGHTRVATNARRLAWVVAGALIPVALVAMFLASQGALVAAYQHIWVWTLTHYRQAGGQNDLRFLTDLGPALDTMGADFKLWKWYAHAAALLYTMLLPVGLVVLAFARAAALVRTRLTSAEPWPLPTARLALLAIIVVALQAVMLRGRADLIHGAYYFPASLLFASVLAWRWRTLMAAPELLVVRWLPLASLVAFGVASLVVSGHRYATDAEEHLSPGGPEARLRHNPAIAYLRAHAHPEDRLAVFPLGGLYYFFAMPPATSFTSMLDPAESFYDRTDYAQFWQEITNAKPRYMLFWPVPAGQPAPRMPVPGYHLAERFDIPYLRKPHLAYLFEHDAAAR